MNIAIFASAFSPHVGGVEELCRQLAQTYRDQGHGVIVLTNRWPRSLRAFEEVEGTPVYRVAMRVPDGGAKAKLNYWRTHRRLRREVVDICRQQQIDVLHVQCVSSSAVYAMEAQRQLNLPLVVTLQGELTMDATGLYQRSTYAQGMMRDALAAADAITACSNQTLAEAKAFCAGSFSGRAKVIYNGVRLVDFENVPPFEHPRPYVLGIGRHVPQKGFDVLLRAMAKWTAGGGESHDLILAGDGTEHDSLKALARALGLGGRVVFPGRVGREAASRLFAGYDLFVLPSRHEPFGIVNLEAMAAGKAVVASRVGGVPEVVSDGQTGLLIPPEDEDALAAAIGGLLSDPAQLNRMAAAGRLRAGDFDWRAIAGQYLGVYDALLLERGRSA